MTPNEPGPQAPYVLKAPTSGAGVLDPRSALVVWLSGTILVGLIVSYLLVLGEVRPLVLLLLGVLGVLCLAPRRGVYILIVFLPFMYALRRFVLNFQPFEQRDPILLFPIITVTVMFLGVIIFSNARVFHYFTRSPLLKACAFLMGVFVLQIFNPLQGSVLVGVAGGMYFIIPILWCFLGLMLRRDDPRRIVNIVIAIGLITALYGLKQHYLGLTEVEVYELKAKEFYKTFGSSDTVRVMSTFSSLGDFSAYLMISGYFAFTALWRSRKNLGMLLVLGVDLLAMVWLAVRTSFILLVFGALMFVVLQGRNARQIVFRAFASLALVGILYGVLSTYDPQRMYDQSFSTNPYVVHTLSGLTHPTQESSLRLRISNWSYIVSSTVFPYPFGRGLGSTTPAARKFVGGRPFQADSYFFELFYGSGLLAPVLFVIIVVSCLRQLLGLCLKDRDNHLYKVVLGLTCALFLGSVFGLAARDSIVGPILWLLVGWTVREVIDRQEAADPTEA